MILINEWLPNPTGSDAAGEWVELWNNGNGPADISSWQIKTKGGSKTTLGGEIGSGGYTVLYRAKTKLVLRNIDEKLFLYDAGGRLIDQSSFLGSAPEGKSFSRLRPASTEAGAGTQGYGGQGASNFVWADPTPGAQNKISLDTSIVKSTYPTGVPLNHPLGAQGIFLLALGTGIVLTAIALFLIKRNAELRKLFFGGN